MKSGSLLLLSLFALAPVGSASAGPLTISDVVEIKDNTGAFQIFNITVADEAISLCCKLSAKAGTTFAVGSDPMGIAALTEGHSGTVSDTLSFSRTGYVFQSFDTGGVSLSSLGSNVGHFAENPTGFVDVSSAFGLGAHSIEIKSLGGAPLPPAWTLMAMGVVGLGFMLYRRGRTGGGLEQAVA
jgi:hypothetical protein